MAYNQTRFQIQNHFVTPKIGFKNCPVKCAEDKTVPVSQSISPPIPGNFQGQIPRNSIPKSQGKSKIQIPRSNTILKIPSQKTYRNVATAPHI